MTARDSALTLSSYLSCPLPSSSRSSCCTSLASSCAGSPSRSSTSFNELWSTAAWLHAFDSVSLGSVCWRVTLVLVLLQAQNNTEFDLWAKEEGYGLAASLTSCKYLSLCANIAVIIVTTFVGVFACPPQCEKTVFQTKPSLWPSASVCRIDDHRKGDLNPIGRFVTDF